MLDLSLSVLLCMTRNSDIALCTLMSEINAADDDDVTSVPGQRVQRITQTLTLTLIILTLFEHLAKNFYPNVYLPASRTVKCLSIVLTPK